MRLVDASGLLAPELLGSQFGSLKVISRRVEGSAHNLLVEVECRDCGSRHMARFHNMRKRPERSACPICKPRCPVTVPLWLYRRCQGQKARCCNPRSPSFGRYGARGIEFRFKSPNAAAHWVAENLGVADRSMELDRKDNDGHYEPGNLRWAKPVENQNNTRKTKGERRARFVAFRREYPEVRYADATLHRLIGQGMTDQQIVDRWNTPSYKPKGKYGTFSMQGHYRGSLQMGD